MTDQFSKNSTRLCFQVIEIQKGIWNSQAPYNSATQNNDAVILKLKSPLSFNSNVRPACLPSSNWSPLNAKCVVSGWGTLSSGGSLPTTLQWVDVPIISNSKCNQAYGSITNAMICAGYQQGGKDSCQGDSGGPLVCSDNGKAVITGVVSFGAGCADADYPGVYARVTTFLSWIKSNMESSNGYPSPSPAPSPSPSGCAKPSWSNDNYCDDENNNAACNYDGGACCNNQNSGWNSYCSSCQCLTPAPTPAPAPSPSACANPSWSNDKYCDDGNNNAACNYDGGACCNNQNSGWNSYCSSCQCKDPSYGAPAPAPAPSPSSCANPSWSNDKFCDDGNNNAACNYDGGACCNNQMSGWDSYCSQCQCLQYGRRTFEE